MQRPKYVKLSQIPKALQCSICANIFNLPVRLHCGHVFCKECIDKWVSGHNKCCPFDRIKFKKLKKKIYLPDKLVEEILSEFEVYCYFRNKGCKEILLKDKMDIHKTKCDFRKISDSIIKKDQFEDESNEILIERMRKEGMDIGLLAKINKKETINKLKKKKKKQKKISDEDDTLFDIFDDNSDNFLDNLMKIKEPEPEPKPKVKKKKINKKKPKNKKRKYNFNDDDNTNFNFNLINNTNTDNNFTIFNTENNQNENRFFNTENTVNSFFNINTRVNNNTNDEININNNIRIINTNENLNNNININNTVITNNNNPITFHNNLSININNSNLPIREVEELNDEESARIDNLVAENIGSFSTNPTLNEFIFQLSQSNEIDINHALLNLEPLHKRVLKKSIEMYKNFFNN